jgi:hypothetical protein
MSSLVTRCPAGGQAGSLSTLTAPRSDRGQDAAPAIGLSAAPVTVRLARPPVGGSYTGGFTLTAAGGAVAFTIAVPPADAAGLAVTPDRGSLAAGQSMTTP